MTKRFGVCLLGAAGVHFAVAAVVAAVGPRHAEEVVDVTPVVAQFAAAGEKIVIAPAAPEAVAPIVDRARIARRTVSAPLSAGEGNSDDNEPAAPDPAGSGNAPATLRSDGNANRGGNGNALRDGNANANAIGDGNANATGNAIGDGNANATGNAIGDGNANATGNAIGDGNANANAIGGGNGNGNAIGGGNGNGSGSAAGGGGSGARFDPAAMLARIRDHRRYPELARRRGVEGVVGLHFVVRPDGSVGDLAVIRSADAALDEAARAAVLAAAPLPPVAGPVEVDLEFRLREAGR